MKLNGSTWEENYSELAISNSIIRQVKMSGMPAEAAAVQLAEQNEYLLKEIQRLIAICPAAIVVGNKVYVWHCPDHLIPATRFSGASGHLIPTDNPLKEEKR